MYTLRLCIIIIIIIAPWVMHLSTSSVEDKWRFSFSEKDDWYSNTLNIKSQLNQKFKDELFSSLTLSLYSKTQYYLFKKSPFPERVVLGKANFFFLGEEYARVVSKHLGLQLFSIREKEKIRDQLSECISWMKDENIGFYIMIVPNKHTVHADKFPIQRPDHASTQTDQIKAIIDSLGINLIDLTGALIHNKKDSYHKYDTHWSPEGALIGYHEFMNTFKKDYPSSRCLQKEDLVYQSVIREQFDLSRMISIYQKDTFNAINLAVVNAKQGSNILKTPSNYVYQEWRYEQRYTSEANRLKVLFIRNSFLDYLIPLFSESFGATVFLWDHNIDTNIVKRENPDVVVLQLAERHLGVLSNFFTNNEY